MRRLLLLVLPLLLLTACAETATDQTQPNAAVVETERPPFKLVLHGGAGTILKANITDEQEAAYRAKLEEALRAGHDVLAAGHSAMDAVVASIVVMEDSELFNAGKGAVYTGEGTHELDASIMDGRDLSAGAIAGVTTIKNPIKLARLVMEDSPHVMLMGAGAERFARERSLEEVPNTYFDTERRLEQLRRAQERDQAYDTSAPLEPELGLSPHALKFGTVGVVALDQQGNLAAGTSTGGMTNKQWGRIGDAPIIGAGTYANNASAAISATGHGEYFIRGTIARDIAAMMEFGGRSLQDAADAVVIDKLGEMGGTGGVVALDRMGNVAMPFNTEGMYRGVIDHEGNVTVEIFGSGDPMN